MNSAGEMGFLTCEDVGESAISAESATSGYSARISGFRNSAVQREEGEAGTRTVTTKQSNLHRIA